MQRMKLLRFGLMTVLAMGACAVGGPRVLAQAPGGPGGGGFQPTPEMKAKFAAWQKYRDQHKNLTNLSTMLRQIREVDKDPQTQFTKAQAGKLLPILKAWRNKPTMTEDQAQSVSKQIGAILTEKQLKKMATIKPRGFGGGPGGGRPGGPGGPGGGGPGGPGGGRPGGPGGPGGFQMPDPPKGGYNPLNPDTLPFERMRPQAKKSLDEFTASLQQRK